MTGEKGSKLEKSKKFDYQFGFNVYKLSLKEVSKATKMMQSEFSTKIGPAGKRKIRKERKKTLEMEK